MMLKSYSYVWDTEMAEKVGSDLLREFSDLPDKRILVEGLLEMSNVYIKMRKPEKALEKVKEAVNMAEKSGDDRLLAEALFRLGDLYYRRLQQLGKAREIYERILKEFEGKKGIHPNIIRESRKILKKLGGGK